MKEEKKKEFLKVVEFFQNVGDKKALELLYKLTNDTLVKTALDCHTYYNESIHTVDSDAANIYNDIICCIYEKYKLNELGKNKNQNYDYWEGKLKTEDLKQDISKNDSATNSLALEYLLENGRNKLLNDEVYNRYLQDVSNQYDSGKGNFLMTKDFAINVIETSRKMAMMKSKDLYDFISQEFCVTQEIEQEDEQEIEQEDENKDYDY